MDFFTPVQLVMAAIISGIMQLIKADAPKRLRPFLPFILGLCFAVLVTIIEFGGIPPWPVLVSSSVWQGIVGAVLSMAGYDVIKKGFMGGGRDDKSSDALGGTDPED